MTYKEIVDIYKTAFIVSLREAARETGNDIYLKVDKALDEHDDLIQKAVQDREVMLADVKKRAEEYKASKNSAIHTPATATPVAKPGVFTF